MEIVMEMELQINPLAQVIITIIVIIMQLIKIHFNRKQVMDKKVRFLQKKTIRLLFNKEIIQDLKRKLKEKIQ